MNQEDYYFVSVGEKSYFYTLNYSYIHIKDSTAKVNGYCGGGSAGATNCVSSYTAGQADYKSHAHILGVQYNHQF